ncbi:TSUP family transporter [Thiofilum flexile]|uniref:TSUP family transporter n=1 Tax=Thiofilum flexile TaxID=125627 RepID=UPI00036F52DE|nr:TSUP family transporter [Thiofilum flexile]
MDGSLGLGFLSGDVVVILVALAVLAGWVDSIGGGGGLITLPALLWAGIPPVQVLATNKLQSSFGSLTATLNYTRQGLLKPSDYKLAVLLTFIGSVLGALTVQQLDSSILNKVIPFLMILFALYFIFAPSLNDQERQRRISHTGFAIIIGTGVGFYDGFFGPGTGTFFVMAAVLLLGLGIQRATGLTKLLNFTSNLAALIVFALHGEVLWVLGLLMGLGQIAGSFIGSQMASKHGAKLIRPVLIVVSLVVSVKLLIFS